MWLRVMLLGVAARALFRTRTCSYAPCHSRNSAFFREHQARATRSASSTPLVGCIASRFALDRGQLSRVVAGSGNSIKP